MIIIYCIRLIHSDYFIKLYYYKRNKTVNAYLERKPSLNIRSLAWNFIIISYLNLHRIFVIIFLNQPQPNLIEL